MPDVVLEKVHHKFQSQLEDQQVILSSGFITSIVRVAMRSISKNQSIYSLNIVVFNNIL